MLSNISGKLKKQVQQDVKHIMFEPGDEVVYMPSDPDLPPVNERPWDVGIVISIEGEYVNVQFMNEYTALILPFGLQHHPLSPKAIRQRMAAVLQQIPAVVEGRVAALVFSELTGQTGRRGFGAADVLRSFLDPRYIFRQNSIHKPKDV